MEHQTAQPGEDIQNKPHRHEPAEHFVREKIEVFESNDDIELALAMLTGAEFVRKLAHAEWPPGGKDDIEEDFEALAGHRAHGLLEKLAPDGKKTAHRIGQRSFANDRADPRGKTAHKNAGLRPIARPAALPGITTAHCQLQIRILLKRPKHRRENRFVMLKIAIHHRKNIRIARSHPLETSRSQSPPPNATDEPHIPLLPRQPHQNLARPVL